MLNYTNAAEVIRTLKPSKSLYCLNIKNIEKQVHLFLEEFPGTVSWAVKSNPEPVVIKAIYEAGLRNFDVASIAEMKLIHELCPEGRMHFNHPVKSPEAIREAYYNYGIRIFVADHIDEIQKISSANIHDITLLIRFFDPSICPASNVNFGKKFGASPKETISLLKQAKEIGFKTLGLAFHPSTQYPDPSIYSHLLDVACQIAKSSEENGVSISMVNIGGGFPASYPSEQLPEERNYLAAVRNAVLEAKKSFHPECEFICEPGRAIVASAASLITRVELNRHDGRLYLNDGFYGGLMEQHFVDYALPVQVHAHDNRVLQKKNIDFILFGPTCDSVDVLRKNYSLPSDIQMGDYIEFGLMGAYTNASATRFNGFEPADIICVEN